MSQAWIQAVDAAARDRVPLLLGFAAQTLQRLGFKNVSSMAGGFNDWSAKGLPVEK
jgi:hypothetical protein